MKNEPSNLPASPEAPAVGSATSRAARGEGGQKVRRSDTSRCTMTGIALRSRGQQVRILPAAPEVRVRFDEKVDRSAGPEGCWPWLPSVDRDGYGKFYIGTRTLRASRVALILHLGRDIDGDALHRCDNPRCVNPAHIYEGTHAQNMWDKVRRGHITGVKLTAAQALDIKRIAIPASGRMSHYERLAAEYGVSPGHIYRITVGAKWAEVRS